MCCIIVNVTLGAGKRKKNRVWESYHVANICPWSTCLISCENQRFTASFRGVSKPIFKFHEAHVKKNLSEMKQREHSNGSFADRLCLN